uniref:GMC_OxRdtase_N domain-containing protein n=1 Tax=Brugia pahangi TaxID=6280 RepID=A0A0N4TR26_BRUPA
LKRLVFATHLPWKWDNCKWVDPNDILVPIILQRIHYVIRYLFTMAAVIAATIKTHAESQGDIEAIIYPRLKSWDRDSDTTKQNAEAFEFANEPEKKSRRNSVISPLRSIFDSQRSAKKVKAYTEPKQRLLDPFDLQPLGPIVTISAAVSPKNFVLTSPVLFSKPTTPQSIILINSSTKNGTLIQQAKSKIAVPSILTLLESFGHSQEHREEVEIGHDRTVNVLGMPIGRKDGISLAPLRGLSIGNEGMFGPIAINNKYNINWGFFNDFNKVFHNVAY